MENFQTPSPSSDPTEGGEPIPPFNPATDNGWHPSENGYEFIRYYDGRVVQTLTNVEFAHYTTGLLEQNRKLAHEQIMGDDHRLTDFWEKAQELADRAGHCEVFDEIAEALGGPSREREYNVTVTYTYTATVTARNEEDAAECATDLIEDNYSIGDLYVESTDVEEA